MKTRKRKNISQKEMKRRKLQRQGAFLYTPDRLIQTKKIKGGYKLLSQH